MLIGIVGWISSSKIGVGDGEHSRQRRWRLFHNGKKTRESTMGYEPTVGWKCNQKLIVVANDKMIFLTLLIKFYQ